jgi:hypothetical protein
VIRLTENGYKGLLPRLIFRAFFAVVYSIVDRTHVQPTSGFFMKTYPFALFAWLILFTLTACSKKDAPPAQTDTDNFLKNTEWVGTFRPLSRSYDKPCALKFHDDQTLTFYGIFYFQVNGVYTRMDSIAGNIIQIEESTAGIRVSLNFPSISESQTLMISDRKTLVNDGVQDLSRPNSFSLYLELFPPAGIDVKGTTWSGEVMRGGPTDGMYAYPDLSAIHFFENNNQINSTYYLRNGQQATMKVPQASTFYVVYSVFQQRGARIYMNGFDESSSKLIPYFGVLAPSGDQMLVDSPTNEARLPNPLQTIAWYGPRGTTPVLYKQP